MSKIPSPDSGANGKPANNAGDKTADSAVPGSPPEEQQPGAADPPEAVSGIPEAAYPPSMDSKEAESTEAAVEEAMRHVEEQGGLPADLEEVLISAEANFRANNGNVLPLVFTDNGMHLPLPHDCNHGVFLRSCLTRFATSYAYCFYVDAEGQFCVVYFSYHIEYMATCEIDRQNSGVQLKDWHVEKIDWPHVDNPIVGATQGRGKQKVGRNSKCPCGSGKKHKKCCLHQGGTGSSGVFSKDQFAAKLTEMVQETDNTIEIQYDRERFGLAVKGRGYARLDGAYEDFCNAAEAERSSLLQRLARSCRPQPPMVPAALTDALPHVLPVVRKIAYFEEKAANYRLLGEHLGIGLVYDWQEVMACILPGLLAKWSVSFDDVFESALENLRKISPTPKFARQLEGAYVSTYADSYDSSRLLLPDLFASLDLQGDPVSMLPNRDTLLISGTDDVRGLQAMADLAAAAAKKPHFDSGIPLRLVDGNWQSFQLPPNHPAFPQFDELRAMSLGKE
ncbi:MAG: SEC-C domain-containing protein [Candidatus Nealsonbacteria bacterium]|nr:SEC-C domain-containing protein [Candidatus Nealsonbacteria bacterium]